MKWGDKKRSINEKGNGKVKKITKASKSCN